MTASGSNLAHRVKRTLRRTILHHLEANRMGGSGQQVLAKKLGLTQPDVSRLMTGRLERFSVDLLLRTAQKVGAEFTYDPQAEAEALAEYTKLLERCRKAKSGTERKTMSALIEALRAMDSQIVIRLKHRRKRNALLIYLEPRPTARQNLDWMTKQLESVIADLSDKEVPKPRMVFWPRKRGQDHEEAIPTSPTM
jgi:predicted XRE-type DNA-binding protein